MPFAKKGIIHSLKKCPTERVRDSLVRLFSVFFSVSRVVCLRPVWCDPFCVGCFLRVEEKADENTSPSPSADLRRSNSASIPSKDPLTASEDREGKAQGHPKNDLFASTRPLRLRGHHRPVSLVVSGQRRVPANWSGHLPTGGDAPG